MDAEREAEIGELVRQIVGLQPGDLCPTCRRSVVHLCASCGLHVVCAACQRAPWSCQCIVL